jgi:hypothetical protein
MTYSGEPPTTRELYTVLASHVNRDRADNLVWPTLDSLAAIMCFSRRQSLTPHMDRLMEIGAIVRTEQRYGTNDMLRRYVYDVRFNAPPGWTGPLTGAEWYARNPQDVKSSKTAGQSRGAVGRTSGNEEAPDPDTPVPNDANSTETAGQTDSAVDRTSGGAPDRTSGGAVHPTVTRSTTNNIKETQAAPPARAGGDARRATTGSSARATRGGSAASSKTGGSANSKDGGRVKRMTREQAAAVRTVEALFPADLVKLLPTYRPAVIKDSILAGLKDRTPQELGERAARRWVTWGFERDLHSQDGKGIASPVGVVVKLLAPSPDCPNPLCEDKVIIGTGEPCRNCAERKKDHRADGPAIPKQAAPKVGKWACVGHGGECGLTSYGNPPADGLCNDCRAEAELDQGDPDESEEARQACEALLNSWAGR